MGVPSSLYPLFELKYNFPRHTHFVIFKPLTKWVYLWLDWHDKEKGQTTIFGLSKRTIKKKKKKVFLGNVIGYALVIKNYKKTQ